MPEANTVALVGDFNGWDIKKMLMNKDQKGVWTAELPLKHGNYQYMFIIDRKTWLTDPNAIRYVDDGFGGQNAVIKVPHQGDSGNEDTRQYL